MTRMPRSRLVAWARADRLRPGWRELGGARDPEGNEFCVLAVDRGLAASRPSGLVVAARAVGRRRRPAACRATTCASRPRCPLRDASRALVGDVVVVAAERPVGDAHPAANACSSSRLVSLTMWHHSRSAPRPDARRRRGSPSAQSRRARGQSVERLVRTSGRLQNAQRTKGAPIADRRRRPGAGWPRRRRDGAGRGRTPARPRSRAARTSVVTK